MINFNPDCILGSRMNYDSYTRSHNLMNKIANFFITNLFNILYNTTFTDIYCCYMAFKTELIRSEDLETNGFEQHAEILCKIIKKGKIFFEVPVNYNGRNIDGNLRSYKFISNNQVEANYGIKGSNANLKLKFFLKDGSNNVKLSSVSDGVTINTKKNNKPMIINLSSDKLSNQKLISISNLFLE